MSIIYCEKCRRMIDTDIDVDHDCTNVDRNYIDVGRDYDYEEEK